MGARGPAPKPTALKLLQGTHRPDRTSGAEPAPDVAVPPCPSWLHREAKREWKRIVPELLALKLLTRVDMAALAAYCQAYAEWREMERAIQKHGHTQVSSQTGYVMARPEVAMRNKALETMKSFLVQFGLTPSSRTRIAAPAPEKKDSNPFARLTG